MYKGHNVQTHVKSPQGQKAIHIIVNTNQEILDSGLFPQLIRQFKLIREYYDEEIIDQGNELKVELIAHLEIPKNFSNLSNQLAQLEKTRQEIVEFISKGGIGKDKIFVSEIAEELAIEIYPYYKNSVLNDGTTAQDIVLPIYTRKYFTRGINDLIFDIGFDVLKHFARSCYSNGYFSLGKRYFETCQSLSLQPKELNKSENKAIIERLFRSEYSTEIFDIVVTTINENPILKICVKDNFFLFHPANEYRLDVHNYLVSPSVDLGVRNCTFLRDTLLGFFEKIFYPEKYHLGESPDRDSMDFLGFEYDYDLNGKVVFDFENPSWGGVSKQNKIKIIDLKKTAQGKNDMRIERCKSVSLSSKYKVFVDRTSKKCVPWKGVDPTDKDILQIDYVSFSRGVINNESVRDALGFSSKKFQEYYTWMVDTNRIFYDYFLSEKSNNPRNDQLVVNENLHPEQDYCTFFIYHTSFLDRSVT